MKTQLHRLKPSYMTLAFMLTCLAASAQSAKEQSPIYKIPVASLENRQTAAAPVQVYKFSGVGAWNDASHWEGGKIPPATLKTSDQVILNGACLMDNATIRQVLQGANVQVMVDGKANIMLKEMFKQQHIDADTKTTVVMAGPSRDTKAASRQAMPTQKTAEIQGKKAIAVGEMSETQ